MDRNGTFFVRQGILLGKNLDITGDGGNTGPDFPTETRRNGDGQDNDEKTQGDADQGHASFETEFSGNESGRAHSFTSILILLDLG